MLGKSNRAYLLGENMRSRGNIGKESEGVSRNSENLGTNLVKKSKKVIYL